MSTEYIAIYDRNILARGDLAAVIEQTKATAPDIEPMVFALDNCKRLEFSWHGSAQAVLEQAKTVLSPAEASAPSKRGRPKLGVTSKEVTLLPRHWEWLATQRGGASVTLRRLVDHAMKNASPEERITVLQNQLHGLMSVFADAPGFEEATRALYRNSKVSFAQAITAWPEDFQQIVMDKFNAISAIHQGPKDD